MEEALITDLKLLQITTKAPKKQHIRPNINKLNTSENVFPAERIHNISNVEIGNESAKTPIAKLESNVLALVFLFFSEESIKEICANGQKLQALRANETIKRIVLLFIPPNSIANEAINTSITPARNINKENICTNCIRLILNAKPI